MSDMKSRYRLVITTPLEEILVDKIAKTSPDRTEVIFEPDLLPPTRYKCDHKGINGFKRSQAEEKRWVENIRSADILFDIPPTPLNNPNPVQFAQNLKWIQTTSSGVGPLVDSLNLTERNVLVTTARGIHAKPLSEFVFLALLKHFKGLDDLENRQSLKHWERFCGGSLAGKSLSIVGMGEVGRKIAQIGLAFDMEVAGLLRPGSPENARSLGVNQVFSSENLHGMLAITDALVLCAPHTSETERMIDSAALKAIRPGAVVINIARGALIEEPALISALESGRISFAALDVATEEPLPKCSPLWSLDNVLISPHSASTVAEENERITELFCCNLERFLEGRIDKMKNRFNTERRY